MAEVLDCAVRLLLIGPFHENHHNPRSWSIPKSRDSREEEGERSRIPWDDHDLKTNLNPDQGSTRNQQKIAHGEEVKNNV